MRSTSLPAVFATLGLPRAALAGALALALAALGLISQAATPRVAPPDATNCTRDHLTVYSGMVVTYRRETGRTTLRIRTDWDTLETVRMPHPGSKDPSRWFLIDRAPFTGADWARIETAPGKLRPAIRAAAWVCDNAQPTVVDWQPPRQP